LQFADDLKMFHVIYNAQDFQQLQNDINKLAHWASKRQLKFNISKCYLLHLGKPHGYDEYNIQGTTITSTDTIKDLGIIIDCNLEFHNHVNLCRTNQALGVIRKTFQFADNDMFFTLYKTLVRPVIEYGNCDRLMN